MKLKLYTAAALIAIAGLVSCGGDNDKEVVDKSIMPTGADSAAKAQAAATNPANPNQITMPNAPVIPGAATGATPITLTQQSGQQTVTMPQQNNTVVNAPQVISAPQVVQTAAAQTTTAPGMNPPHGQPGHRCDISVGAPLNSKPAATPTVQQTTTQAQPQVTMQQVPTTTKTAPGMNPPHGEAGHRCDIAVGAPLNSKPAATPAAVTTTPATITPPSLLAAPKSDSAKN